MWLILLVILIILLVGGLPTWQLHQYGYGPPGIIAVVLVIVVGLFLMGRL